MSDTTAIEIPGHLPGEFTTYTVRTTDEESEAFWLEGDVLTVGWEMTDGQLYAVLSALRVARIGGLLDGGREAREKVCSALGVADVGLVEWANINKRLEDLENA